MEGLPLPGATSAATLCHSIRKATPLATASWRPGSSRSWAMPCQEKQQRAADAAYVLVLLNSGILRLLADSDTVLWWSFTHPRDMLQRCM